MANSRQWRGNAPLEDGLSDAEWAFLMDEPLPKGSDMRARWLFDALFDNDVAARALVRKAGAQPLAQFILEHPGCRPNWFWRFQAPERMRRRVGGIGMAWHSHETGGAPFANEQHAHGVPLVWPTKWTAAWTGKGWWSTPPGAYIDESDPPLYESQAAYLDRHGLLSDAERAALTDEDSEPEVVGLDYGEPIEGGA